MVIRVKAIKKSDYHNTVHPSSLPAVLLNFTTRCLSWESSRGVFSPISSAAATPHFPPCLPHPPASHTWTTAQDDLPNKKEKKSLAPDLFSGAVNIPRCIPSCAASPAPRVPLWHLSCLRPYSNKAKRSKTVKDYILAFSFFSPKAISSIPCGRTMQEIFSKYTHSYLSQERYHRLQTETGGTIAETKRD